MAQAFDSRPAHIFASASVRAATLACLCALTACGAGGFRLDKADVDSSIVTGSIPSTPPMPAADATMLSDQSTIGNAVSSADLAGLSGKPIAWANADTGSRGSVTGLSERRQDGRLCRAFTASRESFDGVALFRGQVCLAGAGLWHVDKFQPV